MFFYYSFLRPPPRSSDPTSPVSITPQIANDLRTSYLEEAIDIFYAWTPSLLDCAGPSITSTARKLTTWRTASIYKNMTIPLPQNAKAGQEWRLALSSAGGSKPSFIIPLGAKDLGAHPLPVISMPIRLDRKGSKLSSLEKQEQIERLYSIPGLEKQSVLCIREQTSFHLDKKIWDSGLGLSSWLARVLLSSGSTSNPLVEGLKAALTPPVTNSPRVLELGSGTGIVSICLSTFLQHAHGLHRGDVLATDLPSAIELIEHNVSANKSAYSSIDLKPLVLDWDDEHLPAQAQGSIDLIVMADVTYNTTSFPSLVRTLAKLVESSKASREERTPCVLLAYKQRDPAERTLWTMLCDVGIDLTLIDSIAGAAVEAVEIWVRI